MKHADEKMTALGLELDEAELATVQGGAEYVDWTTREPYLEIRSESLAAQEAAWNRGFNGATEIKPSEVFQAARDYAQAKELQQFAEQNLNYINRREDAAKQAREADEREQAEREAEEAEDERLLQEAEDLLRESESGAGGGGGGGGGVVNQDPYAGETNASFPIYMTNGSSGEAQISTEQAGPDEFPGGGYSGGQQNQETRLY